MAHEACDVFIAAPSWVSYAPQAGPCAHHAIYIPTGYSRRWRITPDRIQNVLSKKKFQKSTLIINHPGNPNGLIYQEAEIQSIASFCQAYDISFISDEIYGLLSFEAHTSFARFYPEATFTTTGLSKWCGAGGWRLGALLCPSDINGALKKALLGIGSETYSCALANIQMAAVHAYKFYEHVRPYLKRQRAILRKVALYSFE